MAVAVTVQEASDDRECYRPDLNQAIRSSLFCRPRDLMHGSGGGGYGFSLGLVVEPERLTGGHGSEQEGNKAAFTRNRYKSKRLKQGMSFCGKRQCLLSE